MKNTMFRIIACLVGVVALVFVVSLSLAQFDLGSKITWLPTVLDIILKVSVVLLILSAVFSAILNVKDCIKSEGRQYVDKFLLKVVCIFVLLFWIGSPTKDYLGDIIYPALIWIIVPRAYDYITTK